MNGNRHKKIIYLLSLGILLVGAFYLYYNYNPSNTQHAFFPKCPSRTFLHVYCPGCGSQRAVHQLFHGNIKTAFRYNPLMVVLTPVMLLLVVQFVLRVFMDIRFNIALFNKTWFTVALGVVFIVYFILRNIPVAALDFLRPPP